VTVGGFEDHAEIIGRPTASGLNRRCRNYTHGIAGIPTGLARGLDDLGADAERIAGGQVRWSSWLEIVEFESSGAPVLMVEVVVQFVDVALLVMDGERPVDRMKVFMVLADGRADVVAQVGQIRWGQTDSGDDGHGGFL
jgi:hypothetical protein